MSGRLTLLTALLFAAQMGYAQKGDSIVLLEVDVWGQKAHASIAATTPQQHLSQNDFTQLGLSTLTEALGHLSGVTINDYGGAGGMKTVSVRGIGTRHTGVVYDGISLSDCQTGEIDLSRYSLENISSIDFVIGSGDNIFRPARNLSTAATLIINNKLPTVNDSVMHSMARISYGSWQTVTPAFWIGKRFSKRVAASAHGEFTHADNDYPFTLSNGSTKSREHRLGSNMNSVHGEFNLEAITAHHGLLTAKTYYYDNCRRLPGAVHYYTNDNNERLHDRNFFSQVGLQQTLGSRWAWRENIKFNWASTDYRNHTVGTPLGDARYYQREYYSSTQVLYAPTTWLALSTAADYTWNMLSSTLSTYDRPSRHSLLFAFSAKAHTHRLITVADLLWSNYINTTHSGERGRNAHRLTPSVSLSWQLLPHEQIFLRAFMKQEFRMPTFNEFYFYHLGSSNLRPERTTQWNLGITAQKQWEQWLTSITVDGYINRVRDKILAIPFNTFVWQMMNLARVNAHGIDINTLVQWRASRSHRIYLSSNYSWQRARNDTNPDSQNYGKQIAYTPRQVLGLALQWQNPWVNLSATVNASDCRWTTNGHDAGTRIAGYAEVGMTAFRNFPLGKSDLTIRATARNLLDKQYEIIARYPMPGRSWKISASWTF